MSLGIRLILLGFGLSLFVLIFELVRRGRFREELSIAWFAVSILLMAGAFADRLIDPIARKIGIGYPPALVVAWVLFCLVIALLYFSAIISDLKGKIKELSQKIALMEYQLEREEKDPDRGEDRSTDPKDSS
jgi:hypothetical protein